MEGNVPFKEGAQFKKGDLLVQIYNEDVKAAITSGKSNFLRTLSSILPDLRVDFPKEYPKWKTFFNQVNVHDKLPELPEITSEKEQVFMASMGVLAEYYSLQQQEINIDKYKVYAPFNGTFVQVNRQVGAVASMGAGLASIIRTDRLEVVVPVPAEDAKWIKTGNEVKLLGSEGQKATGTVTRVADFIDEATQSVNVYVKYLPKGKNAFRVGEFVDATFFITKEAKGIKIPREALLDNEKVYIVEDGKLQLKDVVVERKLNDSVLISGLEDGVRIVSESLVDVEVGDEVAF
jgi:RND family efflux transporter MFP subunit